MINLALGLTVSITLYLQKTDAHQNLKTISSFIIPQYLYHDAGGFCFPETLSPETLSKHNYWNGKAATARPADHSAGALAALERKFVFVSKNKLETL